MTVEKKKLARRGIKVIFYLYIIGIFYFVLLSERYGRDTGYDTSHVNLVLFKEINRFWTYRHLLSTEAVVTNLFGNIFVATYSYNRLKEIYEYQLFNSISGRSCVRVLIEDYIMMKYLVKSEASNESIWREYQLYGMGLYKLVLARYREYGVPGEHHFDEKYIEALVNEFKNEEIINMDTTYFNKHNVRLKAEAIGEKNLYGLYYDYDSSFEHGLWGAIRESSLLKCDNPAHNYHCIPDINGETRLKTVLPDCIMIMNKTVSFLDEIYGIPKSLLDEVVNFEIKPIIE